MSVFQRYKTLLFILTILAFASAAVYVYFSVYQPLTVEVQTKQQQLKAEKQLVEALEGQLSGESKYVRKVTNNLQYQVPVKPMTEKMLLDFEKAELAANSLIQTINFSEGEAEAGNESMADAQAGTEEGQSSPQESLPAGIKKLTAELTVESPGYFEMETFLKQLEKQTRILKVERLQLTGPKELEKVKGETKPLTYSLTVSAYYMPSLIELIEDTPKIDSPTPAKKADPFVTIEK
ncbi:hypothetical protein [Bacillus sp. FJAT-42315]|uniref:hypothetical protein n=1 Tax=Bacillus sp. FJAT-42315 TaxID=2014077 RepID=UPI000C23B130|nr:hypothetical protein [Bacillus sp. FJAT-42315]